MTDLDNAIIFATNAHAGQLDKAGLPYILHPLRVMASLKDSSEDILVAAVLHDVMEDCGVSCNDLFIAGFSMRVISAVFSLSRRPGEDYLSEFIPRCGLNEIARKVKIADINDNALPWRVAMIPPNIPRGLRYAKAVNYLERYR
jgi:hypothetical protein